MQDSRTDTPRVLVVDPDRQSARALCGALREAGLLVHGASDVGSALRAPLTERAVLRHELPDGDGLSLLSELRERDGDLAAVLIADAPDHALTRAAWRAGALDLFAAEDHPAEIAARLLSVPARPERATDDVLRLRADQLGVERSLRRLGGECLAAGFGPAARMRLLTAAAEGLDNAWRHAYGGKVGPIELRASLDGREATLWIEDQGRGCEAASVELDSVNGALPGRSTPGGLARMRALVDGLRFDSTPGAGTRLRITLTDHGAALDSSGSRDLSDRDWLTPSHSKALLTRAHEGRAEALPPALACLVGRLLTCTTDDRRARRALWS
ncbi:MAG: ATP-binding protein [Planctomycetota bacterium]